MKAFIKNSVNSAFRFISALRRPSKKENMRLMNKRGDMPGDFVIRPATENDLKAIVAVHVQAWNETYWNVRQPPTAKTRQLQWEEKFKDTTGNWFCFVVTNPQQEVIGFALGKKYNHINLPTYKGELNKLYLLPPYYHLGIGRKLLAAVGRQFLSMGINNMVLFGNARNPSCSFYERMGGTRLYTANGEFHGGYAWDDLKVITG